jgi:hypothetical protein
MFLVFRIDTMAFQLKISLRRPLILIVIRIISLSSSALLYCLTCNATLLSINLFTDFKTSLYSELPFDKVKILP